MTVFTHYQEVEEKVREKILACGRQLQEVTIVTVSKNYPLELMQSVYREGGRNFGESRVQEAMTKISAMPSDCKWHLIGALQSNKIAKALLSFHLIHSVDDLLLAQRISQVSQAQGKVASILLQVNTSGEKTKQGLSSEEWSKALEGVNDLPNIRIEGLMTMAPNSEDQSIIRSCFRKLYDLRETWAHLMKDRSSFRHLSMGMSNDYLIAIEEGATLLRIGSAIFT